MGAITSRFRSNPNRNPNPNPASNPNPIPDPPQQTFSQSSSNQQYQQYAEFSSSPYYIHPPTPSIQLLTPRNSSLKVAAIVISFCQGLSYDNLFTSQEQKSEQGSQTLVYAGNESCLQEILNGFDKGSKNELINQLVKEIQELDVDCTVFNWECCSNYTGDKFKNNEMMLKFIGFMLGRGHMLMFSDFSLMALIGQWREQVLGPNPFTRVQETSGNVILRFHPETLKKSPSAQLQLVGTLSDGGMCNVFAAGGTIGYTVNWKVVSSTEHYKLELLSIASNLDGGNSPCEVGDSKGAAGHCLLTYPKGGKILTSMTHWMSLMQIDTSEKKIIEVARMNFGDAYADQMELNMGKMQQSQKGSYVQERARWYVQTSAPCNNKLQKQKSNFKS